MGISLLEYAVPIIIIFFFQDEVVNVKIPKFEMSGNFDMLESLKALGLVDLIEKKTSDLGLMAPKDTLKLSSFTHR